MNRKEYLNLLLNERERLNRLRLDREVARLGSYDVDKEYKELQERITHTLDQLQLELTPEGLTTDPEVLSAREFAKAEQSSSRPAAATPHESGLAF